MSTLIAGGLALLVFGLLFNRFVAWLQARNIGDFTAWQVVVGVLAILCVQTVATSGQSWRAEHWTLLTLSNFIAAGTPMAWGSWQRRRQ